MILFRNIILLLLLPSWVFSQQLWLEPASFLTARGEPVELRIRSKALQGNPTSQSIRQMKLFYGGSSDDLRSLIPDPIRSDSLILQFYDEGTALVSLDVVYDAGNVDPAATDSVETGSVIRYLHCSKSLFQVGELKDNEYQRKSRSPFQFMPLKHPYSMRQGDSLAFRLLYNDLPMPDADVLLVRENDGGSFMLQLRTDSLGQVLVPVELSGKFMLFSTRSEPLENESNSCWQSISANFTWGY